MTIDPLLQFTADKASWAQRCLEFNTNPDMAEYKSLMNQSLALIDRGSELDKELDNQSEQTVLLGMLLGIQRIGMRASLIMSIYESKV